MRKRVFTCMCLILLLAGVAGCSKKTEKDSEGETEVTAKVTKEEAESIVDTR